MARGPSKSTGATVRPSAHSIRSTQGSLGTVSHSYEDDGVYLVTVYVTDKDTANWHATFNVTVNNVAPDDRPSRRAASVNEGSSTA